MIELGKAIQEAVRKVINDALEDEIRAAQKRIEERMRLEVDKVATRVVDVLSHDKMQHQIVIRTEFTRKEEKL